ncbi:uncharacterized protein EDB91DRAFT_1256735 [Suillus paluster]|uniref:uncharacterized protein n=1 Tax=Suillus paluster TaxID=48578 RepID=UPI001B85EC56|nr:uncharacterized protein EDB91DRAFT_1256735 [Suillus paluster]KAG1720979.1 hypothetical protein EDB91DRAFT_1256735 [Suillus paluster]
MFPSSLKRGRSDQDQFNRRVRRRKCNTAEAAKTAEVNKVEDADNNAWLRFSEDPWGLNPGDSLSDDPWGVKACEIKKRLEKVSTRLVVQGPPTKDSFWRAGEIPLVGEKVMKKRTFVTKDRGETRVNITNDMKERGRLKDLQRDSKRYDTPEGVIILYYDDDDLHSDDDDPYSDEEFFSRTF